MEGKNLADFPKIRHEIQPATYLPAILFYHRIYQSTVILQSSAQFSFQTAFLFLFQSKITFKLKVL